MGKDVSSKIKGETKENVEMAKNHGECYYYY